MTVKRRLIGIGFIISLMILTSQTLFAGASASTSIKSYPTKTIAIFDDNSSIPINDTQVDNTNIEPPPSRVQVSTISTYTVYIPFIANPYPILNSDNFSDPNSGWINNVDVSVATIAYTGGEYRILNKTTDRIITVTDSDYTFDLFEAHIDIRSSSVITGGYGLAFGFDNITPSNATQNHMFQVYPSTQTWRYIRQNLSTDVVTVLGSGTSSAINTGTETNRLRIELTNSTLVLVVNGAVLHTTTPPTTSNSRLGLINIPTTNTNHDVFFDDFVIFDR